MDSSNGTPQRSHSPKVSGRPHGEETSTLSYLVILASGWDVMTFRDSPRPSGQNCHVVCAMALIASCVRVAPSG